MPYAKPSEVPKQTNTKTPEQRRAFQKAFNRAVAEGKDEATAFKIANAAASRAGKKG